MSDPETAQIAVDELQAGEYSKERRRRASASLDGKDTTIAASAASSASANSLYIADTASLKTLVARLREILRDDARLAFDTEFIRERTYAPVLEIIQIAAADGAFIAIVDVPALGGDLDPLSDLFFDSAILKIVHAGTQDVEILTALLGERPTPVYDTQVAAAFAGYSLQTGYGALVQSALNVRLSKEEGFADWSRRPLTIAMREYAENDVRYLAALHDRLSAQLVKRGRAAWAQEQTERILIHASETVPPEELWKKVGGRNVLDSKGLAILRELAIWRDTEARRRDKPRRSVVKDEILIEVARRAPKDAATILGLRSAPPNLGERAAEAIVAAVKNGLAIPESERPRPETNAPLDEQGAALVELLSAVVRIRAMEENLPPSLLASGDDLRTLAAARRRPESVRDLFPGWRGQLIGDELRAVIAGEVSVSWDKAEGRLRLTRQ